MQITAAGETGGKTRTTRIFARGIKEWSRGQWRCHRLAAVYKTPDLGKGDNQAAKRRGGKGGGKKNVSLQKPRPEKAYLEKLAISAKILPLSDSKKGRTLVPEAKTSEGGQSFNRLKLTFQAKKRGKLPFFEIFGRGWENRLPTEGGKSCGRTTKCCRFHRGGKRREKAGGRWYFPQTVTIFL